MKGKPLHIPGFSSPKEEVKIANNRLLLGGKSGAGKGHLPLMTAPEPVGMLPLDENALVIAKKAREAGREVYIPKYRFNRVGIARSILLGGQSEADKATVKKGSVEFMKRLIEAAEGLAASEVRTVVIDGMDRLWAEVLLAHWGTTKVMPVQRGDPGRTIQSLLDMFHHKNLVLTTKVKQIWRGEGNDYKPVPGAYEPVNAWGDLEYCVPNTVLMGRVGKREDADELRTGYLRGGQDKYTVDRFSKLRPGVWWAMVLKAHNAPMNVGAETLLLDDEITYRAIMDFCAAGEVGEEGE